MKRQDVEIQTGTFGTVETSTTSSRLEPCSRGPTKRDLGTHSGNSHGNSRILTQETEHALTEGNHAVSSVHSRWPSTQIIAAPPSILRRFLVTLLYSLQSFQTDSFLW